MSETSPTLPRRAAYDRIAERYDDERGNWERATDEVVAQLLKRGTAAISACDLGCGTGSYIAAQLRVSPTVRWIGVDASGEMLRRAQAKIAGAPFVQGRAEALPFGDASIDYVYCSLAYHHFDDKPAAFMEIARS